MQCCGAAGLQVLETECFEACLDDPDSPGSRFWVVWRIGRLGIAAQETRSLMCNGCAWTGRPVRVCRRETDRQEENLSLVAYTETPGLLLQTFSREKSNREGGNLIEWGG